MSKQNDGERRREEGRYEKDEIDASTRGEQQVGVSGPRCLVASSAKWTSKKRKMTGHQIYNQNQTKVSSDVSVMVNRIWNYERDRDKEEVALRRGMVGCVGEEDTG